MPQYVIVSNEDKKQRVCEGTFESPADAAAYMKSNGISGSIEVILPTFDEFIMMHIREQEKMKGNAIPDFIMSAVRKVHIERMTRDTPAIGSFPAYIYIPERKGYIAYTENMRGLIEDRQKSVPISTFLSRYSTLSSHEIATASSRYTDLSNPVDVSISFSKAAFIEAYLTPGLGGTGGGNSCMAYPGTSFRLAENDHPASAYAGDEDTHPSERDVKSRSNIEYSDRLAIAVGKRGNTIVARAVVWPGEGAYVSIYGADVVSRTALEQKIKELGYKKDAGFNGARMFLRKHPDGGVIAPYIDGDCKLVDSDGTITDDDWEYEFNTTSGRQIGRNGSDDLVECDRCGDMVDENDVRSVIVSVNSRGRAGGTQQWCSVCVDDNAFFCEFFGDYVSCDLESTAVTVFQGNDDEYRNVETWTLDAAHIHARHCDRMGGYVFNKYGNNTLVEVVVGLDESRNPITEEWHKEFALTTYNNVGGQPLIFFCERSDNWYSRQHFTSTFLLGTVACSEMFPSDQNAA